MDQFYGGGLEIDIKQAEKNKWTRLKEFVDMGLKIAGKKS